MKKFDEHQYEEYWRTIHAKGKEDLCCVCFPDKPLYFNLFFDRIEKHILRKYIKKNKIDFTGKTLLDIGCGRGRWLRFFGEGGAKTIGIDLSGDAVQSCRSKNLEAYTGSITDMNMFEDESFDYVTSITVLLHLPFDIKEEAVKEIGRVVKKGGRVILIENTWDDPSPHVFSFKIEKWSELFEKHGMHMCHCSAHYFNFCRRKFPCHIKWVERLAIYLDYILDFACMEIFYGKRSDLGLQHLMVFEKR